MTPIRATARLQLHRDFNLRAAAAQVAYYAGLGVSHLYLSPIGTAVAGSSHGYDVVDPATVNPELGGEVALRALAASARDHGIGLIIDIVPNHMAAVAANPWWWDVLRNGRRSRHADWFDIDWDAPGRDGKLWLPVLDRSLAQALADGVLRLARGDDGELQLAHYDHRFPLRAGSWRGLGGDALDARGLRQANRDAQHGTGPLPTLVQRQHYRLAWWRSGNDLINYRRFFDITSLAALRVEHPPVFDAVHALPLRLAAEGLIDGVRVDHVDGLADPTGYLRRLRVALDRAGARRALLPGSLALYVEKILAPGEALRSDWACDGSTGYDFMDQVGALLHGAAGKSTLTSLWRRHAGRSGVFALEERQARDEILRGPLQAEFNRTLMALQPLATAAPEGGDFSTQMLARALFAVLRHFPVYRLYGGDGGLIAEEAGRLHQAVEHARQGVDEGIHRAIGLLERLLAVAPGTAAAGAPSRRLRLRFEQLSSPLNAKSVEDTAFYRHGVLLSRNEVGSNPDHFALAPMRFHAACAARGAAHPRAMLATATHDHKRGEDLRARLAVLSMQPGWWREQVDRLEKQARLQCEDGMPDAADRLMLWQMMVGAWPLGADGVPLPADQEYARRLVQWQTKALREAKHHSAWTRIDVQYEKAAANLVERVLLDDAGAALREILTESVATIAPAGALNSLVQTCLRLTVPGVPDLYQGAEGWDLSLVDPDNRRPVDYALRRHWQSRDSAWHELLDHWPDGEVKAGLIRRLLQLRRELPALFAHGRYRPLPLRGRCSMAMIAFQRKHGEHTLTVALPLHVPPQRLSASTLIPAADALDGASLPLPRGIHYDVLGRDGLTPAASAPPLCTLLARSPLAVFLTTHGTHA